MPKVLSASIRLVQKMNRMNKNGEYPIYLVISFNGKVERATGISCHQKHWDRKREVIKSSCPNAAALNKQLSDIKQRCIDRKIGFELSGRPYNASQLLQNSSIGTTVRTNGFKAIADAVMADRRLKRKTCCKYRYAINKLSEFLGREDFIVDELTEPIMKDFCKWLAVNDSTKRDICSCIASVWNYAISRRLVSPEGYPFRTFKFAKIYRTGERVYYLDRVHIKLLYDEFLSMVADDEASLDKRSSKPFSLLWFLLCYKLNGSAPIEITMLRPENCRTVFIGNEEYYAIDFYRQKTHSQVKVRLRVDEFSRIAVGRYLQRESTTGYLYPIIRNPDKDPIRQSSKLSETAIKNVREVCEYINEHWLPNRAGTPFINVQEVVMYTARHSFANHYINTPGATIGTLASLLSRSPSTIGTYVHQLANDKEIADAVELLPI